MGMEEWMTMYCERRVRKRTRDSGGNETILRQGENCGRGVKKKKKVKR